MENELLSILGKLVLYAGGGAAIAVGVFQFLGKSYIDHKFAARLEALKHDQNVIVAKLKVEIDSMLSGALKFQEREFDVLPGVWDKLYQASAHINWFTSRASFATRVTDMEDFQFEEWVETLEFSAMHKGELHRAQPEDRQGLFEQLDFIYKTSKVRKVFGEYQQYLQANAIFFPLDLKTKLAKIEDALWQQIADREALKQMKDWGLEKDPATTFEKVIPPLRDEVELLIRKRLESHMKAAQGNSA